MSHAVGSCPLWCPSNKTWLGWPSYISSFGYAPTLVTTPLVPLDVESGTICRQTADSRTCHTAILDSHWRCFYLGSGFIVQCELQFLTALWDMLLLCFIQCAVSLCVCLCVFCEQLCQCQHAVEVYMCAMCRRRAVNRKRAAQLLMEGKRSEARDCLAQCIDITPQMALELINVCISPTLFRCCYTHQTAVYKFTNLRCPVVWLHAKCLPKYVWLKSWYYFGNSVCCCANVHYSSVSKSTQIACSFN